MAAALPAILTIGTRVEWLLHRMGRTDRSNELHAGDPVRFVEGEDYGNDNGYTIVPQPETFTRYAISLFLPENANHLYVHSKFKKCFMFVCAYNLPDGLGIVYDRTVELQWRDKKKDAADPQSTTNYHFSLIATSRMPLSEFLAKVHRVFSMPHVMPCRIFAGAGVELFKTLDPNQYPDGAVGVVLSTTSKFFEHTDDHIDRYNCIVLHTWIEKEKPTFDQLLGEPLYARIAFNVLGKHDEEYATAAMRMSNVRDTMGRRLRWDPNDEYNV